jgi:hypothetical protein
MFNVQVIFVSWLKSKYFVCMEYAMMFSYLWNP